MPLGPSASTPRLHRHLRALQAVVIAAGHRAYATLARTLLVEAASLDPNTPEGHSHGWIVVGGAPGGWTLEGSEGLLCGCDTIEEVAEHLACLIGGGLRSEDCL